MEPTSAGIDGIEVSGCGGGCLDSKALMVEQLGGAKVSFEHARRTAPL